MADMTVGSAGASRIAFYAPRLGFALAVIALIMLALAPVGWRTGMWHFRISFYWFMQPATYLGIAAGIVSLIALFWWPSMGNGARVMAVLGLAVGVVMAYVPLSFYHTLGTVPRIHDITTDTDNPPAFSPAVMQARAAEQGDISNYDQKTAALQKQGYPDLAPVQTSLPPGQAFERALAAAQGMSGWTIVGSDAAQGRIDAYQRTTFMGFTDDIVIRVAPDGSGSRIDTRSESRQGRIDFGVNAKRVRAYEAALKQKLG
jgi:uncharacterized protein (DUF1499 family)